MTRFSSAKRVLTSIALLFVLVSTLSLAAFFIGGRSGEIGVIEVSGAIVSEGTRSYIIDMINHASRNDSIKALVLTIDSPGGWTDATQEIYGLLRKLGQQKPIVVAVVGLAASGGYHIAVAAEFIYVLPASIVGNIGVIGYPPPKLGPFEDLTETGPYKLTGISPQAFSKQVEALKIDFLNVVKSRRGERLQISAAELSKGQVYFGDEAIKNGMADAVGTSRDAVEKAAALAGLTDYRVSRINDLFRRPFLLPFFSQSGEAPKNDSQLTLHDLMGLRSPPAFYHIYLTNDVYQQARDQPTTNKTTSSVKAPTANVVIDFAHKNYFRKSDLTLLLKEIVEKGHTYTFLDDTKDTARLLEKAASLVIINPESPFTDEEVQLIVNFANNRGSLLLIWEPERAIPRRANVETANSLAGYFGLIFANGYLYNLYENEGNYRNILVQDFKSNNITDGIRKVVLYTASHVYSQGNEIAFTSKSTQSSESEISAQYSPIVYVRDRRVLAVGDATFLKEPSCYAEDNYRLLTNIAKFLSG